LGRHGTRGAAARYYARPQRARMATATFGHRRDGRIDHGDARGRRLRGSGSSSPGSADGPSRARSRRRLAAAGS
jgi:hypothetical protein